SASRSFRPSLWRLAFYGLLSLVVTSGHAIAGWFFVASMTCGAATSRLRCLNRPAWHHQAARSLVEHSQCRPAVSRFQSQKQRARVLDVSLGTTLGGRLQGNRSRMIWTADENQGFGQAPYGCAVKRCFFHSKCPRVVVYAGPRSSSPSSYFLKPNLHRVSRSHDQWCAPRPRRRYL